jgi:hypothetical protein
MNYLGVLFQGLHVMWGHLNAINAFYGYCLYILPINLLFLIPALTNASFLARVNRSFMIAIWPNLAMCIAQTFIANSPYVKSFTNSASLTTHDGFARAYGVFSAPAGLSLYISVVTAITISNISSQSKILLFINFTSITTLYLLSGSRLVYFNLLIVLFFVFLKNRAKLSLIISTVLLISASPLLLKLLLSLEYGPITAFYQRIIDTSRNEDTLQRLWSSFFGFHDFLDQSLIGKGFGSFAIGTVGYSNSSNWIENDLSRNIAESGTIIGVIWILMRISFALISLSIFLKSKSKYSLFLFSSIFYNLLFGPISGQSTISLGCWLAITFAFAVHRKEGNSTIPIPKD